MIGRTNAGGNAANTITSIIITTPPTKTVYNAGETVDLTGIIVKANWKDGSQETITNSCTFNPASGTVIYETTTSIDISYYDKITGVTFRASQDITVNRIPNSLVIVSEPTKTEYEAGETLDLTGLIVKIIYNSGAENTTSNYTTSPAGGSELTGGTSSVLVSYTENSITVSNSFNITVNIGIALWSDPNATTADLLATIAKAESGKIDLSTYWSIGDTRTVTLPAISTTSGTYDGINWSVGETHTSQKIDLVLMDYLPNGFSIDGYKPLYVVGMKDSLATKGYMNSSDTNTGGWNSSKRRGWCNQAFKTAIDSVLSGIFKQFSWQTGIGGGASSGLQNACSDYFGLTPEKCIFGSRSYSITDEANLFNQWEYYTTSSNRIKKLGKTGSTTSWWECSPSSGNSDRFCYVDYNGSAYGYIASGASGLAPFGCIGKSTTIAPKSFASATDAEITAMVAAHDAGQIDLTEIWSVGDQRTVQLSAMTATGVGESHVAQSQTLVLMDSTCDGFTITGTNKKPTFIVGLKNFLAKGTSEEYGYMNSTDTNTGGWNSCARRTWCNNVFKNALPSALLPAFKQFTWQIGRGGGATSGLISSDDYFALPPGKAIFGSTTHYAQTDEDNLFNQWEYYTTSANRKKYPGDSSTSADYWWECSPCSGDSYGFCYVAYTGGADYYYASDTSGLAPFGCI